MWGNSEFIEMSSQLTRWPVLIRQNLLEFELFAIPLAAGVLAPIGILLSPAIGALLMSLSTVIVAINAQLLRRVDLSVPSLSGVSAPE